MAPWDGDYFPKPSQPRAAKGGIQAKSQRGAIGETWWSQRFVKALEAFTDANRLSRGRAYARKGQVMGLEVAAGQVRARVQGSRPSPYKVSLVLPVFSQAQWEAAEQAMAERAVFLAALLAGEMPQPIEEAFAAAGLSLFPAAQKDLQTTCSCPDWANPCKHVAATLYILAEAFDADPFLIFAWRGRTKDALLERLRALRAGPEPEEEKSPIERDFWRAGAALRRVSLQARPAGARAAVLVERGLVGAEAEGDDLALRLVPFYVDFMAEEP